MNIHFLHNSSEGMFLCLPEELYILSAFFVRYVLICRRYNNRNVHVTIIVSPSNQNSYPSINRTFTQKNNLRIVLLTCLKSLIPK